MPDFTRAEISTSGHDLTPYLTLLRRLAPGNVVTLPLEAGESRRIVMRALNSAAEQAKMRLSRVDAPEGAVRFRVLPRDKRAVTMSEEARQARVEKARSTRAQRQQERERLETMGIDPAAVRPEAREEPPEQPDTTQIEAPEEAPTPDAAAAPAAPSGRSPRTRRRTSATTGG